MVGGPRRKPCILYADRGYDYDKYRRELRARYEVRADLHLGLVNLACAIICWRKLPGRSF